MWIASVYHDVLFTAHGYVFKIIELYWNFVMNIYNDVEKLLLKRRNLHLKNNKELNFQQCKNSK